MKTLYERSFISRYIYEQLFVKWNATGNFLEKQEKPQTNRVWLGRRKAKRSALSRTGTIACRERFRVAGCRKSAPGRTRQYRLSHGLLGFSCFVAFNIAIQENLFTDCSQAPLFSKHPLSRKRSSYCLWFRFPGFLLTSPQCLHFEFFH